MSTHAIPTLNVEPRTELGSRPTRRLRDGGRIALVVYGHEQEPMHVSANYRELTDVLHTGAHVVEVKHGGKSEPCLVKDLQWNYLGNKLIHIDLARVDLTEKVTVSLPVIAKGEAIGLKEAGTMLEHPVAEIEVACRADQIPDAIEYDVTNLVVGSQVHAGEIPLPAGMDLVSDRNLLVFQLHKIIEKVEAEAGAAAVQPEVIGRKEDEKAEEK